MAARQNKTTLTEASVAGTRGLLRLLATQWKLAILTAACLCGLTGVNLYLPQAMKRIVDDVLSAGDYRLLYIILGSLVGVYVSRNVLFFISRYATALMAERSAMDLRGRVVKHLNRLSLAYITEKTPAKLLARATDDVNALQQFIRNESVEGIINLFTVAGVLVVIFTMNTGLAIRCVALLPLFLAIQRYFKKRISSTTHMAREHTSVMSARLVEMLMGASVVKAAGSEQRENAAFKAQMMKAHNSSQKLEFHYALQKVAVDLAIGASTIYVIWYGTGQVIIGSMTKGDLVAFFSYMGMFFPLAAKLTVLAGKVAGVLASLDRVQDVLDVQPSFVESEETEDWEEPEGNIDVQGVSFRYGDGSFILKGASFNINSGEHVVIQGASGSGKSTLLSLIARLMDTADGSILLDGKDVRRLKLTSLRRYAAFVQQEPFLFSGTLRDNIRYANPGATDEDVEMAAKAVLADRFVEQLPDGLDTRLGEGGVMLSLGQRIQISIARAVLQDPKILMLDDPFSSLDEETARELEPRLRKLMKGRTTIVATSKPSFLVEEADRTFRVTEGQVHELKPAQPTAARPSTGAA